MSVCECVPDPLLAAAQHKEGLDVVLFEVSVSLSSVARLHLVVSVQVLQSGFGDVDAPASRARPSLSVPHLRYPMHTQAL